MKWLHAGRRWREAVAGVREQLQIISMNGCSAAKRRWPSDVVFVDLRRRRTVCMSASSVGLGLTHGGTPSEDVWRLRAVPQDAASTRESRCWVEG